MTRPSAFLPLLAIFLTGCSLWNAGPKTPEEQAIEQEAALEGPSWASRYYFKYTDPNTGKETDFATSRAQLIERNPASGEENVLWENNNLNTLAMLKDSGNSLTVFAYPNENTLILRSVVTETNAMYFDLFSFDIPTRTLRRMTGSDGMFFSDTVHLSPDERYLAWVEPSGQGARTLYTADLTRDQRNTIKQIETSSESLWNGCINAACVSHEVEFTGPRTVRYAVYEWGSCEGEVSCDEHAGRPFLRYEEAEIPAEI